MRLTGACVIYCINFWLVAFFKPKILPVRGTRPDKDKK